MHRVLTYALFVSCATPAFCQLTPAQKVADFTALAGLYDKNYGPYEWKRDVIGFDLLDLTPWLTQVNASKDDLSFYDICVRYVASLQDSHDEFILNADFEAFLPFTVDIYDGKVLVDFIDRTVLPLRAYPFQIGDQLISVDGTSVSDWITKLQPYTVNGSANQVSRNRLAASMILDRYQGWYTYATQIGTTASVVIQGQNGSMATYTMPWQMFGTPLVGDGPIPDPTTTSATGKRVTPGARQTSQTQRKHGRRAALSETMTPAKASVPGYLAALEKLRFMGHKHVALAGGSIDPFGAMDPVFAPPAGFKLRLVSKATDEFLSGTFPSGALNLGFIRIPSFEPNSETNALSQFLTEITYFNQNTNGLVIDIMSNGGGDLCYTNMLLQMLIPTPFREMGLELRANQSWVTFFSENITEAELTEAPQYVIEIYQAYLAEVQKAQAQSRGLTGPLPICSLSFENTPPYMDSKGNNLAYTKPIVLLTDNFTLSAAESFAATLQDAKRVTVYGTRTDGGGGNVTEFNATAFSEAFARVTMSLEIRAQNITTPGYPPAPLIENIGVYPDVMADYMTLDNLQNAGTTFVAGFTTAISNLVTQGHP